MPTAKPAFPVKWVLAGIGALIAVVALVSVLTAGNDNDPVSPDDDTSAVSQTGEVIVDGSKLPRYSASSDPGVGETAPTVTGTTFDGEQVVIGGKGRPQVVFFLAHWCPHCQREVPVITEWIDDEGMPEGVDLLAVSTSVDDAAPNYPPSAWLAEEAWPVTTMADDDDSSAAEAFGLTGFPFFVAIDADGEVVARGSGELTVEEIEELVDAARS